MPLDYDLIIYDDYPYMEFDANPVKYVPCNTTGCDDFVNTPLLPLTIVFILSLVFCVCLCVKGCRNNSSLEGSNQHPPTTTQMQQNVVLTRASETIEIRSPSNVSPVTAVSNSNTVTQPSNANAAVCSPTASTTVCLSCASRTPVAITLSPEDNIVRSRVKSPKTDENPPSYEDAMSTPPYGIAIKK